MIRLHILLVSMALGSGVLLLLGPQQATAQETLPPYHWSQTYLDYFKTRGLLPELSRINRPYSRLEVARLLARRDWNTLPLSATEKKMWHLLLREYRNEIQLLYARAQDKSQWKQWLQTVLKNLQWELLPGTVAPALKVGTFGLASYTHPANTPFQYRFHTQLGLFWGQRLTLYQNLLVFNHADTGYIGKKFRQLYAYGEQAYLSYQRSWFLVKFGRDFFQIGPGRSGQLLISDNSRPFDMYYVRVGSPGLHYAFWGFLLNRRSMPSAPGYANRYLNGHRLSFHWKNRFFLGISEVVLYGGPNATWDLGYMNPLLPYYGHLVNGPGTSGNILVNLDFDWYPHPNWEIYGEFLVDDFQVDRKEPGDLEPNELGFLAGVNTTPTIASLPLQLTLEYVQVRNRTYNVMTDWEKYLHRNRVIGYYLGNNFEHIFLQARLWPRARWQVEGHLSYIRQGEGSVQGEFNTDFLKYTVEQGYHEPFPYGVVERHLSLAVHVRFYPSSNFWLAARYQREEFWNYQHRLNRRHSDNILWLSLWFQQNLFRSFSSQDISSLF